MSEENLELESELGEHYYQKRNQDIPFGDWDQWTEIDVLWRNDRYKTAVGIETVSHPKRIGDGWKTLATVEGYFDEVRELEPEKYDLKLLVDHPSLKDLRDLFDDEDFQDKESLRKVLGEHLDEYLNSNVLANLEDFYNGGVKRGDQRFPEHDYEWLEQKGIIETNGDGSYTLVGSDVGRDVIYRTPRFEMLMHPQDFEESPGFDIQE